MRQITSMGLTVAQIKSMIDKETLRFDSYIQRSLVWEGYRKSLLIRTIINGFPKVPNIYCTSTKNEKGKRIYSALDGKQRLTTAYDFCNDNFALDENLDSVIDEDGEEHILAGKKFSELDEMCQNIIMNYSFSINYYDDLTDDEIAELFYLTNNGKPLSAIEHIRSLSPSLKKIQEIGEHELFKKALSTKAFEKYTNEDLVIKSYAILKEEKPCLDNKVIREIMKTAMFEEEDVITLKNVYSKVLDIYNYIEENFNEDTKMTKRVLKRVLTRTHLLSILPLVNANIDLDTKVLAKWIYNLFGQSAKSATKYEYYNDRCTSGSGHAENVKIRLEILEKDFNEFMGDYAEDIEETEETVKEEITDIELAENVVEFAENASESTESEDAESNEENTENVVEVPENEQSEVTEVL